VKLLNRAIIDEWRKLSQRFIKVKINNRPTLESTVSTKRCKAESKQTLRIIISIIIIIIIEPGLL